MPALRGSLTYARFFVEGELPDDFRERFMRAIRHRAMKPLEADDEELERTGWCRIAEPFELELAYDDVFYNAFVNLGVRTDRWAIPGSVMRSSLREAEQAYLQKKGRERLTRREKGELKLLVGKRLRRQTSPQTRGIDLSWSLNDGIVRFFSHAPKAASRMTELFTKTFGLRLVPESPYALAARLGLKKTEERAWQDLEPTLLAEEEES